MKRLLALVAAALLLVAATPDEVLPALQANGYFIAEGSGATEAVVSRAVSDGRAEGGRLYIVVLANEPPGGATTFADSTLDLLDDDGYVFVVAPQTVGYAGDNTTWSVDEMDAAVETSLGGDSDDEVVEQFISTLTAPAVLVPDGGQSSPGDAQSGGISLIWVVIVGAVVVGIFMMMSRRSSARRAESRMAHVKGLAKEKLDEVANDILEMENEVSVTGDKEALSHYQRASALYSEAMEQTERATTVQEMVEVTGSLDLAIWELDCAEALLDGKPKPPKPGPPAVETATQPLPLPEAPERPTSPSSPDFERRPQRQSTGSGDMLNVLLTMMAMGSMRNRGGGFGGSPGGWTSSGGGFRRPPMGGGGGGRIRGGGRRRG